MTWQDDAERLFGPDWQAPLADVASHGRLIGTAKPRSIMRSVQRWKEDGVCPEHVGTWLATNAHKGRAYGAALRHALRHAPDRSDAAAALRTAADDIEAGRLP